MWNVVIQGGSRLNTLNGGGGGGGGVTSFEIEF